MYIAQVGLNKFSKNSESILTLHYNNYNREYDEGGYFDWYNSDSAVLKAERRLKVVKKYLMVTGLNINMIRVHLVILDLGLRPPQEEM